MKKAIFLFILIVLSAISLYPGEDRGVQILVKNLNENYKIGKQYLVLIGINKYTYWPPLQNPVEDTRKIKEVLTKNYYIDEVIELLDQDATKANIIKMFENLQDKLKVNDSLLVFYSGHGHLDKMTNTGFWIPVNAGIDKYEQSNWLPNTQIRGIISNIEAIHLLVISDSCFSGDLLDATRSMPDEINNEYFKRAYGRISRQILTSGASESVPDASEFCKMLEMSLGKNSSPYIDPLMLFNDIRLGVKKTSPLIGNLKDTGHQDGASFLLFLKQEEKIDMTKGSLVIESAIKNCDVYLDSNLLGPFGTGSFENISVGTHRLELKGDWIYWESEINIAGNKSLKLKALPEEFGILNYSIKEGAKGEIKGKSYTEKIEGEGTIPRLWVGDYTITVKGKNFNDYQGKISMKKGLSLEFEPKLEYTEEYSVYLKEIDQDNVYKDYSARLNRCEKLFNKGARIGQEEMDSINTLLSEISGSKYTDLKEKGETLRKNAIDRKYLWDRHDYLNSRKKQILQEIRMLNGKRSNTGAWIALGTGIASFSLSGISLLMGNTAYDNYEQADIYDDIIKYKDEAKTWDTLCISGLCTGIVSTGISILLFSTNPDDKKRTIKRAELLNELSDVDKETEKLELELY